MGKNWIQQYAKMTSNKCAQILVLIGVTVICAYWCLDEILLFRIYAYYCVFLSRGITCEWTVADGYVLKPIFHPFSCRIFVSCFSRKS